jgi:hypothetical protein
MQAALKSPKKRARTRTQRKSGIEFIHEPTETTGVHRRAIRPGAPDSSEGELAVRAATDIQDLLWWSAAAEPIPSDVRDPHTHPTQKP